jgi:hypothetical protein
VEQPPQPQASDADIAADLAIAHEHGDREAFLAVYLRHPDAREVERELLEEMVDEWMEAE